MTSIKSIHTAQTPFSLKVRHHLLTTLWQQLETSKVENSLFLLLNERHVLIENVKAVDCILLKTENSIKLAQKMSSEL